MKIKFGAMMTDARGALGGQVFSKNRGGAYVRTKVTPVNPRSTAQIAVRNRLTTLSQQWRGLTGDQRNAWRAAVSLFAKTDIFGDVKNPSGANLFIKINSNLLMIGQAVIISPPSSLSVLTTVVQVLQADDSDQSLKLTCSGAVPAGTYMVIRATPPMSPGVKFIKSQLRNVTIIAPAGLAQQDFIAPYISKYGGLGSINQRITAEVFFVNSVTGVQSGRQTLFANVIA